MSSSERTAQQLEILVEAACRYGLVLKLLRTIHALHNGHELEPDELRLFDAASIAALLAEAERARRGVDIE